MKRLLKIFTIAAVLFFSCLSWASWSVWDQLKFEAQKVEGRVKAIAIDEDEQRILVKLEMLDDSGRIQTKIIRVCPRTVGQTPSQFLASETMELIRQAMSKGDIVAVSTGSVFDGCMSSLTYVTGDGEITATAQREI